MPHLIIRDKDLDKQAYLASGVENQVDYQKF